MQTAYIITGTLNDDQTVTLDEAPPLGPMKVRLAIEPLALEPSRSHDEVIAKIWARQQKRGSQLPTRANVDADLKAEHQSPRRHRRAELFSGAVRGRVSTIQR